MKLHRCCTGDSPVFVLAAPHRTALYIAVQWCRFRWCSGAFLTSFYEPKQPSRELAIFRLLGVIPVRNQKHAKNYSCRICNVCDHSVSTNQPEF